MHQSKRTGYMYHQHASLHSLFLITTFVRGGTGSHICCSVYTACLGCLHANSHMCAGQCSRYGVCLAGSLKTPNTATTITLVTTGAAPQTTSIKLGYRYGACAPGQQSYTGAECELGATASDSQRGNLTSQVLVCAPSACTTAACVASKSSQSHVLLIAVFILTAIL